MTRKTKPTANRPSEPDREFVTNSRGEKVRNTAYNPKTKNTGGVVRGTVESASGDFGSPNDTFEERAEKLNKVLPMSSFFEDIPEDFGHPEVTHFSDNPYYDGDTFTINLENLDGGPTRLGLVGDLASELEDIEDNMFYSAENKNALPDEDTRDALGHIYREAMEDAYTLDSELYDPTKKDLDEAVEWQLKREKDRVSWRGKYIPSGRTPRQERGLEKLYALGEKSMDELRDSIRYHYEECYKEYTKRLDNYEYEQAEADRSAYEDHLYDRYRDDGY